MQFNVYSARDKIKGREFRIILAETDGAMCRDNLPLDIRNKDNPIGIPFNDLEYVQVATYDSEKGEFKNTEHRTIDIMKAYKFKVETKAEREPIEPQKLAESVEQANEEMRG